MIHGRDRMPSAELPESVSVTREVSDKTGSMAIVIRDHESEVARLEARDIFGKVDHADVQNVERYICAWVNQALEKHLGSPPEVAK